MSWIGKYDNQKKTIITHRKKHTNWSVAVSMTPRYGRTLVGLPPGWVDSNVGQLYVSIDPLSRVLRQRLWGLSHWSDGRSDAQG